MGIGPQPLRVDPPGPNCNCGDTLQFQGNGPDSGEVVDIAIDPRGTSDQTLYIATNDGGVWKSTDAGQTWRTTMDPLPSLSMGAVALDPGNPDIVYAGTGNPFDGAGPGLGDPAFDQLLRTGVGIYKSVDAGQTWLQVGTSVLTGKLINRIVLPASGVLVVATTSGLFRSVDGGQSFGANPPLFNDGNPIRSRLHLRTGAGHGFSHHGVCRDQGARAVQVDGQWGHLPERQQPVRLADGADCRRLRLHLLRPVDERQRAAEQPGVLRRPAEAVQRQ